MNSSSSAVPKNNQQIVVYPFLQAIIVPCLIGILFILFMVHWCFRCRQNHPPDGTQTTQVEKFQCDDVFTAIPVIIYGACTPASLCPSCSLSVEPDNCSICLAEFTCGQPVRVLPRCKHMFHKDCIDQWMPLRSSCCPVCRDEIVERDDVEFARTNCTNNASSASLAFGFSNTAHRMSFL